MPAGLPRGSVGDNDKRRENPSTIVGTPTEACHEPQGHEPPYSYTLSISYLPFTKMKPLHILLGLAVLASASACNGLVYDGEGDCEPKFRVEFRYDHNLKFADAFDREVPRVTLYVLDKSGEVAWQGTTTQNFMDLPSSLAPGTYDLLAWAGTDTLASWQATELLGRRLERQDGHVRGKIDALFHGRKDQIHLPDSEGVYIYDVPLVKDVNSVCVVLQHMSGEPVDPEAFDFTVTEANGLMDARNVLLPDQPLTYHAWRTASATAGGAGEKEKTNSALRPPLTAPASQWSAALAELTVGRLMADRKTYLTVTRRDGQQVFSVPLTDYALMVKSFYDDRIKNLSDQEYLDRQDQYNMTFFLNEDGSWMDAYILINSWHVVLQNSDI